MTMEPPHCWLSSTSSQMPTRCMRTMHCPSSALSNGTAIFDEGNHSLLRLNHGAEHTAVNTLRVGIGVLAFNAQLATVTARD